jgi:hypothetical protein
MGCKFSITLDQQRPKTPSWFSERKTLRKESIDQTVQTQEEKPDEEPEKMSSPEQVYIKAMKRSNRQTQPSQWKP